MSFRDWLLEGDWHSFLPRNRQRQRLLPFANEPNWNRKPDSYIDPNYKDESPDQAWSYDNLYHVTTNLSGVIASGGLLPRSEVGTSGLGGGWKNEGANLVSVTHSLSRAKQIYDDIIEIADVVQGRTLPSDIFKKFLGMTYDDDPVYKVLFNYIPRKRLEKIGYEETTIDRILDQRIVSPESRYEFYQELERAISEYEFEADVLEGPLSITGFTASFEDMVKINPQNVAILQLVAKKEAKAENFPEEEELRFYAYDLRVVRYLQPKA